MEKDFANIKQQLESNKELKIELDMQEVKNELISGDESLPKKKFYSFLSKNYELINYNQLPDFMRFNVFIQTGYRPQLPFLHTLKSIFHYHNETLNVWTHLLGALLFTLLMIIAFCSWMIEGNFADYSVFFSFIFSAQILLLSSTTFHLVQPCADNALEYSWLARLDYVGISFLIVGSYYAPIYYLFYCQPIVAIYYTGGITFLAGCAIAATFAPMFDKPGFEIYRAGVFMLMGWFGAVSVPHAIFLFGFFPIFPLLWRLAMMGLLYSIGVVFYVSRFPERCYPGKFDFGFNSHVIWHIFVILATFATYKLCTFCFDNRFNLPCFEIFSAPIDS